jgi:hypothetical protein
MGDLIQFPKGEPEGEMPQVGWCAICGVQMAWPNDGSAWPETCPNGCAPVSILSWDWKAHTGGEFEYGIGPHL